MEECIQIYPNPYSGEVVFEGPRERQLKIEIYNALIQLAYKKLIGNGQSPRITLSFLNKGVHVLRVNQKGKISYMKRVKE